MYLWLRAIKKKPLSGTVHELTTAQFCVSLRKQRLPITGFDLILIKNEAGETELAKWIVNS